MSQYPRMPLWSGLATPVFALASRGPHKTLPLKAPPPAPLQGQVFALRCASELRRLWQDWLSWRHTVGIATYSSCPEGTEVLPERSVSMDDRSHYPVAALAWPCGVWGWSWPVRVP